MSFEVVIKREVQNEIANYVDGVSKTIIVSTLDITNGLLKKGDYYIPVEHILFIKGV